MAANARNQTGLFEAASAGVSTAIQFSRNPDHWPECDDGDGADSACEEEDGYNKKICGQPGETLKNDDNFVSFADGAGGTQTVPGWAGSFFKPDPDIKEAGALQSGEFTFEQKLYCIGNDEDLSIPSELFLLSRGVAINPNSDASREIEVRIGRESDPNNFPPPPISTLNKLNNVAPASANALTVVGECGPAVLTDDGDKLTFEEAVKEDRLKKYLGGIAETGEDVGFGSPWDDPTAIEEFVDEITDGTDGTDGLGSPGEPNNGGVAYRDEAPYSFSGGGDTFGERLTENDAGEPVIGTGNPQITYFDGDVSMGGNVSGSGIMIVEGTLDWKGTPQFDGLIVVLGGEANFKGGGEGGANGSLILTDLNGDTGDSPVVDLEWGPTEDQKKQQKEKSGAGGGQQTWTANCALLDSVKNELLPQAAKDLWQFECDCSEISFSDASDLIVTSWRENIGWRDDDFVVK